jgi:hypothetical protein
MMRLSLHALPLACCMAVLLAAAPPAHADSVSGSVWELSPFNNVPVAGSPVYGTSPTATFTVSNTTPGNLLNFNSGNASGLTDYSLAGFLGSGGDTVTISGHSTDLLNSPAGCNSATCTTNTLFQFTGSTTLTNGVTYTFEHDDGLLLYLGSSLVINEGGPTSATITPFTVCASGCDAVGGTYSFTLDYAEVFGAPAVLITDLPLTSTPEPSSFILLGSGLFAAAGVIRRRMNA